MTHEFKHPNYYKDLREKSKGLWHNIHKKIKEGRPMRKKGEKGAPTADDIKKELEARKRI